MKFKFFSRKNNKTLISPKGKPPGRTSFIQRQTRPSFIMPPGDNSSDEEPRRVTISVTNIDDDLEDMLANRIRKSMIQARFNFCVVNSRNLHSLVQNIL